MASQNLATFSIALESGEGLVPRLLSDKVYADQALNEFSGLLTELNQTVARINAGEGTAGKIIADPSVYESLNDILIGINESRMLRWLIRNRQQKGIEKRFDEEQKTPAPAPVKQPDVRTQITPPEPTKPPVVPPTTGPASNDSAAATTTQGPPD